MKIKQLDRRTVKQLRIELDSALADVASKYGLDIKTGNIRFSDTEANVRVKVSITGERMKEEVQNEWSMHTRWTRLEGTNVGDTFTFNDTVYTIDRWDSKKRKYPVIAHNPKGASYKFSSDIVANSMGK